MHIAAPSTSLDIARWLLVLTLLYCAFRIVTCVFRKTPPAMSAGFVSDSLLFSGSVLLLVGIWAPETLRALGDPTPYLVLAGLAGFGASVGAAFRDGNAPKISERDAKQLNSILSDSRVKALLKEIDQESSQSN